MKLFRRAISLIMTGCIMASTTALAAEGMDEFVVIGDENDSITIIDSNDRPHTYTVTISNDTVSTTSVDDDVMTTVEVELVTGEITTIEYVDGMVESVTSAIDRSVASANAPRIVPMLVFPSTYQPIGSLLFKKNATGVAYNVNFETKQTGELYDTIYNLNKDKTDTIQKLTTAIIGYIAPLQLMGQKTVAQYIVQKLIDGGVAYTSGSFISKFTENNVTADVTTYSVKFTNQYNTSHTEKSDVLCVRSGNKMNSVIFNGVYPQFLQKGDNSVASMIYYFYDAYGYEGVQSYTATRTVPYFQR